LILKILPLLWRRTLTLSSSMMLINLCCAWPITCKNKLNLNLSANNRNAKMQKKLIPCIFAITNASLIGYSLDKSKRLSLALDAIKSHQTSILSLIFNWRSLIPCFKIVWKNIFLCRNSKIMNVKSARRGQKQWKSTK